THITTGPRCIHIRHHIRNRKLSATTHIKRRTSRHILGIHTHHVTVASGDDHRVVATGADADRIISGISSTQRQLTAQAAGGDIGHHSTHLLRCSSAGAQHVSFSHQARVDVQRVTAATTTDRQRSASALNARFSSDFPVAHTHITTGPRCIHI
ncbi:MAG: hypothetical protein ACK56F_21890, partial [bacterium]